MDERARKKEGGELIRISYFDCPEMDSTEKLIADCEKLIKRIQARTFSGRDAGALRCQLDELLQRQAEITKRECDKPNWDYCETCEQAQQVDKLNRENVQLAHDLGECMAEREELRTVLGKMLDIAHELQRIGALYGVD